MPAHRPTGSLSAGLKGLAASVVVLAGSASTAVVHAAVVSQNFGNPDAAQYYSAQAYAEIKGSAPDYTLVDEGGRVVSSGSPVGALNESGSLAGLGSTMSFQARSSLEDGFVKARTYASMSVNQSIGNGGYNVVASQGSRTQGLFSSGPTPGRADFHFSLTGNAVSPYGLALGRLDFLVRPFSPGQGSFWDVFGAGALSEDSPGQYTFTYLGSFASPLDVLFYSAAAVVIQDGASVPAGAAFSAFADFENTFELTSIDLYEDPDGMSRIRQWTLTDQGSGRVVFDQDGRVMATVPAPSSWALAGLALAMMWTRRRLGRSR